MEGLDVLALTLAESPEPQPLRTRLARAANNNPTQQAAQQGQQQQQQQQTQLDNRQQVPKQRGQQPSTAAPAEAASGRGSAAGAQQAGTVQETGVMEMSQQVHAATDSDDDDFQPRVSMRTRMTAARASANISSNRRAVAGMRSTTARRAARSTSSRC